MSKLTANVLDLQKNVVQNRESYRNKILKEETQLMNLEIEILLDTEFIVKDDRFEDLRIPQLKCNEKVFPTINKNEHETKMKKLIERTKLLTKISKQVSFPRKKNE